VDALLKDERVEEMLIEQFSRLALDAQVWPCTKLKNASLSVLLT
jgi:hypothetical protein